MGGDGELSGLVQGEVVGGEIDQLPQREAGPVPQDEQQRAAAAEYGGGPAADGYPAQRPLKQIRVGGGVSGAAEEGGERRGDSGVGAGLGAGVVGVDVLDRRDPAGLGGRRRGVLGEEIQNGGRSGGKWAASAAGAPVGEQRPVRPVASRRPGTHTRWPRERAGDTFLSRRIRSSAMRRPPVYGSGYGVSQSFSAARPPSWRSACCAWDSFLAN